MAGVMAGERVAHTAHVQPAVFALCRPTPELRDSRTSRHSAHAHSQV